MIDGQRGPVEPGRRPGVVPMDLDAALERLQDAVGVAQQSARSYEDCQLLMSGDAEAMAVVQALITTARAYVKGPSPGRLEALAALLQEPVGQSAAPVDVETVVQAYLTERDMIIVTREAARRLGILG